METSMKWRVGLIATAIVGVGLGGLIMRRAAPEEPDEAPTSIAETAPAEQAEVAVEPEDLFGSESPCGPRPASSEPREVQMEHTDCLIMQIRDRLAEADRKLASFRASCGGDPFCVQDAVKRQLDQDQDDNWSLYSAARKEARDSKDPDLLRHHYRVFGYAKRFPRSFEQTIAQAWGNRLAGVAPGLQEEIIEASHWVGVDSILHEPLAWVGGYPACKVVQDPLVVVCSPD